MAAVERAPERQFVSISYKLPDSRLGSVFSEVTEVLLERGWLLKSTSKTSGKEDLILGTAQAGGLNYKQLGRGQKQPLVNFYRGYEVLCRKSQMVDTLRAHSSDSLPWLPRSFLFYPAKPEKSETEAFTAHFNACAAQQQCSSSDSSSSNLWILKPSDGGKGQRIECMSDLDSILSFIQGQPSGSIAWVVQEYLAKPLLLPPCGRKFDMRCWCLLTSDYSVYVYREGIMRTCSVPFSLHDLSDRFVHLSNHCIQEEHPLYGKYEPTNELFYKEFDKLLPEGAALASHILPQVHTIVQHCFDAARDMLEVSEVSSYKSFQLFGFDFMMDQDLKVYLIEINSSPAVADALLSALVTDMVDLLLVKEFGDNIIDTSANGFELLSTLPQAN